MVEDIEKGKRLAKNTIVLYLRMLFLMVIGLYTSRVFLQALGVEDFGIYNVVGGFVGLFAIISKSLSGAASRFLNFEMGRGDKDKLKVVFSSTVTIQIFLAIFVALLAESVGVWFVNTQLVIPSERIYAANWCFQLSVITFCSTLVTVPYNAAIIAHEKMTTFAYVSIFEGLTKLCIAFLIMVAPFDRLIFYALLLCILQLVIQYIYRYYCKKQFEECTYKYIYDKFFLRQLLSYAGWGYIGSTSVILRNQGINILINLFFGPVVNAARAVANQVLHAVDGFVQNFITAVRPQITQSYAAENYDYLNKLLMISSKFSYYLFLLLSLPILLNTDYILNLWLTEVPEHSILFVQLTLLFTMINTLVHPLSIAQAATGKIRDYQLATGGLQLLNLPISWVCLKLGCPAESVLIVAIVIIISVVFVSVFMLKRLIPFDTKTYMQKVILNVVLVTFVSYVICNCLRYCMPGSFLYLIVHIGLCVLITGVSIFYLGCNKKERFYVVEKVDKFRKKFFRT